uniref:rRNA methylase-like protein n=1 Tax=Viscum album TaxID=3972 RepID=Q5QJ63_VISAL|nr:rRNA methylase-like protein [Viscum album]
MKACKALAGSHFLPIEWSRISNRWMISSSFSQSQCSLFAANLSPSCFVTLRSPNLGLSIYTPRAPSRFCSFSHGALALEISGDGVTSETLEGSSKETVEKLLSDRTNVDRMMKMERKLEATEHTRWFPYLDMFKAGNIDLSSSEILEALDPFILGSRKERIKDVVKNRSYSVWLVVEGATDFGNISAVFRSADALGLQSVHVISCGSSKRYRENRHVSMGAEKWLDIELWDSTQECFRNLKSRGYRIVTAHLESDAVSIYNMDWTSPTAIVTGNEKRGISEEALGLSDLHCSIPMRGMVDSLNVSVAAGILMHHAVRDRTLRLGGHGDLTMGERQILLAEFSLRHSNRMISIVHEHAARKPVSPMPRE